MTRKYALSEKTLAKSDAEFNEFLQNKDPKTQARYAREKERYDREHGVKHKEAPAPSTRPRPSGSGGMAGGNRRYKIIMRVQYSDGRESHYAITKNNPYATDDDRARVAEMAADDYHRTVAEVEPDMTIDQLTGNRVLISGSDREHFY